MFVDETISRNQACVGSWSIPGLKIWKQVREWEQVKDGAHGLLYVEQN